MKEGVYEHIVNYVSCRWTCTECANKGAADNPSTCEICAPSNPERQNRKRKKQINENEKVAKSTEPFERHIAFSIYQYDDPLKSFVEWLLNAFDSEYDVHIYSHYGGRFDQHFVLRQLYLKGLNPKLTMTGNKIYQMMIKPKKDAAKLIFRDSYLIINSPLSALPATFNLKCENKLYFPHLFNKVANKDVILPCLPPKDDYMPKSKKPDDFQKFEKWYEEHKNEPFSLKEQLKMYVLILYPKIF